MYGIPLAGGLAAGSAAGAATIPDGSSPVLQAAHSALAYTGFAFGAYVAIAVLLIMMGLLIRKASTISVPRRSR